MTSNKNINLSLFDCNAFQEDAISQLKSGQASVKSGVGSFELETPKDRESSYVPKIIKKMPDRIK